MENRCRIPQSGSAVWIHLRLVRSATIIALAGLLLAVGACAAPPTIPMEPLSETPEFLVRSWQTREGLPQNSVQALLQTEEGYLWVGTRGGLARFDGVRFTTYGLTAGLKSLHISDLASDGKGGIWIGTIGGGLSRWRDGEISTLTTADGLAHNDVMAL